MSPRAKAEPIAPEQLTVLPATAERWADVVTLLGGNSDRGCWCQAWRGVDSAFGRGEPGLNRMLLLSQVENGPFAPGLIAYLEGEPVGWCGIGPRAALPRMVNSRTIPTVDDLPVWSLGCFNIRAGYRRRGVAKALLDAAIEHVRAQGAPAIEAYPIDPEGTRIDVGFGFVGFTPMFEAAGFRRVVQTDAHSAGRPRWLMRLDLTRAASRSRSSP